MAYQTRFSSSSNRLWACLVVFVVAWPLWQHSAEAQGNRTWIADAQTLNSPMRRAARNAGSVLPFTPIGTASLVDQYRSDSGFQYSSGQVGNKSDRDVQGSNRHVVRLQQNGFAAPPLPSTGSEPMAFPGNGVIVAPSQPAFQDPGGVAPFGLPPSSAFPAPMSNSVNSLPVMTPNTGPPPALPMNSNLPGMPANGASSVSFPTTQVFQGNSDMLPIARPQLNDSFATVGNSCCVSPPSNYVAAMGLGNCVGGGYQSAASQSYIATGAQVGAPPQVASAVPSGLVPVTRPSAPGVPKRPLINLGQDKNAVVVGQGLIGQPVAYVPGQCVRNWIRYIFP